MDIKQLIDNYTKKSIKKFNKTSLIKENSVFDTILYINEYKYDIIRIEKLVFKDKSTLNSHLLKLKKSQDKNLKYGLVNPIKYNEFLLKLKLLVLQRMKKLKQVTKGENLYLHLSGRKIDLSLFKSSETNYMDHVPGFYNPGGLWYSCNFEYFDWWISTFKNKKILDFNDLTRYDPCYIYKLNLAKLNIKKISSCEEFIKFCKIYKSKKLFSKNTYYLNWRKIYKDFDGLELCPYPAIKCNSYFKKNYHNVKDFKDFKDLFEDNGLESFLEILSKGKLNEEEKSMIWSLFWKAPSGVIWKKI